ncbi:SusC/RagA family TonB-linked outer membrane protein [Olivibacter domesticus]|uniref:TonB-linked outer membrane protein, SusC/RagA family n=1 Tax=Olivibacter domesticus TaxID=407022 RepID=A0A1H7XRJ9_OLID1|nr:SusC/RagA family TonB-linked outer membrane protein [Olivibacter domesticus]SEM36254.1 TonB-linked outer membrane protein, SusC/RagA family [Olivibacter domesticus]
MEKNKPFQIQLFILLLVVLTISLPIRILAQNLTSIAGTIRSQTDNTTLPGVSVKVKGQTTGTSSNTEGRYRVEAKTGDILVFSSVGYQTKELAIGNDAIVDVLLIEDAAQLNEVVVTALGIERQTKSLTYATQELKNEDLTTVKDPSGNVMNSLNGKVAGAVVTPAATGPGGAVRVVLRGNRSISGNNNALIVVDGVPIDNTMSTEQGGGGSANTVATQQKSLSSGYSGSDGGASINPEDVESITVLKGPAAAALYGSRAANGALMITTKKGKDGAVKLNYSGGITTDKPLLLMDFQNTYGRGNGGVAGTDAAGSWGAVAATYPDNVRSFYNTGTTINNSVNISGGTAKMQGYASYTNNAIAGIVPTNHLDRNTLNLRLNNEILPGLTTDVKVTYLNQKIKNKPRLGDNGVTNEALIMPRDMSSEELKNFESINAETLQPQPLYWTNSSFFQNPYWDVRRTSLNEERNRIMLVGSVKYQLTDWLFAQGRYSLDRYDDKITGAFHEGTLPVPTLAGGRYQENHVNRWERNIDFLLSGTNEIGTDFGVNYNIGAALLNNSGYNTQSLANGLRIPNMFDLNFASTPTFANIAAEKEIQSVYGSATLNYKQQLFLDVTARNDWSSTLPAPHSYFYPSFGLSGLLSEMIKMPSWVSYAKVRGAYTQVGNDADPYLLQQTYSYSPGAGDGFVARDQIKYIDDLKPEKTKAWEIGTEWRFFEGRLGLDASVYKTNTVNQLIFIGLPQPSGYNNQYVNVGDIENKGLEIMLTGNPVKKDNLSWNTTLNFALNRNKVLSLLPGIEQANLSPSTNFGSLLIKPGGSYGDIYGFKWAQDANGAYQINNAGLPVVQQLQNIGNFNPDYTISWLNQVDYKQFTLSFMIDGRVGGTVISGTDALLGYFGLADYTTKNREGGLVLPGVLPDGSPNNIAISAEQLWTQVSQGGTNAYGDFFAYDATNFRLRELSLGYTLTLKNSPIKTARFSLTGRNLFFFYRGKSKLDIPGIGKRTLPVDPEAAIGTSNFQGIESGILPSTRSFGFNLNLSF